MLTKEIQEAIAEDNSTEYFRLLRNYGLWSRYFGCSGYPSSSSHQTYSISDESAMIVDKAFGELKKKQPNLFRLMNLHYVQCKSPDEIFLILKKQNKEQKLLKPRHRSNYFEFNPALDTALKYINTQAICDLLRRGEQIILDSLRSMNDESV
ncbi:MAG: hypothetical protein ACI4M9_07205 [Succinivibrio sp.]